MTQQIRDIIYDQINRHVAMTQKHRDWLAKDIADRVCIEIEPALKASERLESARDELKRQRTIWTGSKNDSWAVAAIDTELGRN